MRATQRRIETRRVMEGQCGSLPGQGRRRTLSKQKCSEGRLEAEGQKRITRCALRFHKPGIDRHGSRPTTSSSKSQYPWKSSHLRRQCARQPCIASSQLVVMMQLDTSPADNLCHAASLRLLLVPSGRPSPTFLVVAQPSKIVCELRSIRPRSRSSGLVQSR